MTETTYGIQETKDMLKFIIGIGEAVDISLVDGKIDMQDIGNLMGPMMLAPAAFDNVAMLPKEIKDLDPTEAQELFDFVEAEFDIANDKIEIAIKKSLQIAVMIFDVISTFKKEDVPA